MIQVQDSSLPANKANPGITSQSTPVSVPAPVNSSPPVNLAPAPVDSIPANPVSVEPKVAKENPIQGLVGDLKSDETPKLKEEGSLSSAPETKVTESEIDDLLAQLEKLSQEIETKADSKGSVSTEVPEKEPKTVVQPTQPAQATAVSAQGQAPIANQNDLNLERKDKKDDFDMDKFLLELEEKIEAGSQGKPELIEKKDSLNEESFRKNRISKIDTSVESPDISKTPDVSKILDTNENSDISKTPDTIQKEVSDTIDAKIEKKDKTEELESQNIFEMLNIVEISAEEREQFLTELEELIWEDFIGVDLELLLTTEEYGLASKILDSTKEKEEKREELLIYIEKIFPDIEEIMYEKALGLKEEMFIERVRKMELAVDNDEALLKRVARAKSLAQENKWKSAIEVLNQV